MPFECNLATGGREYPLTNLHPIDPWRHSHDFAGDFNLAEKRTTRVMILTAAMMLVEIAAGTLFGSMALLADGWHMATHVAAFGIALFAYRYARNHADNPRYTFGTGKVNVLGGFASAVALAVVALVMAIESVMRMVEPQSIRFNEAIGVAAAGLLVNIVSGLILQGSHEHGTENDPHRDHNLRAAYLHVVADAMTSVFAIAALLTGKYFGWVWLDPAMGLVGAVLITRWSCDLARDTSAILLDGSVDEQVQSEIRRIIEKDAESRIADLHVWRIGPCCYSVGLSVVTHCPKTPDHYKRLLIHMPHLVHILIEVNPCHETSRAER